MALLFNINFIGGKKHCKNCNIYCLLFILEYAFNVYITMCYNFLFYWLVQYIVERADSLYTTNTETIH